MKTQELIDLLARQAQPPEARQPTRRFSIALVAGTGASTILMAVWLGLRPDLAEAARVPAFWARLLFALVIAAASLRITTRLCRPGLPIRPRDWIGLVVPIVLAWGAGAVLLAEAAPSARLPLLLGHSWKLCAALIAVLSIPSAAAMVWAVRGMAPVQLRRTGAAVGFLAGAMATIAFCLHCPELAPTFWSVWYALGMAIPGAIGAIVGPRWLRW